MVSKFSQGPPLEKFAGNLFNFAEKITSVKKIFKYFKKYLHSSELPLYF